jgi:hypothetical protein
MKKINTLIAIAFISLLNLVNAQNSSKPSICMIAFDQSEYEKNIQDAFPFIYNELIRLGRYAVMDKYDLEYTKIKDTLVLNNCYSSFCLSALIPKVKTDYYFTGSISTLGSKTLVNLRLYNTSTRSFERIFSKEFLQISGQELLMFRVAMNEMFGQPNDPIIEQQLTQAHAFDNEISNPYQPQLSANGPRMGGVMFMGQTAGILQAPTYEGGFGSSPYTFQFGYQFEKQYLNEGNFQALFEFVPMISGLDQGRVVPSIAILNGIRNNRNGFELAIGPSFTLSQTAEGMLDDNGIWQLKSHYDPYNTNFDKLETRLDSRGEYNLNTSLIIAVGKTFKSGKMNLPVNVFYSPGLKSSRLGVSFGWNAKDRFKKAN